MGGLLDGREPGTWDRLSGLPAPPKPLTAGRPPPTSGAGNLSTTSLVINLVAHQATVPGPGASTL